MYKLYVCLFLLIVQLYDVMNVMLCYIIMYLVNFYLKYD